MVVPSLTLHIFALGPPEVRLDGHRVSFPTRKTLALLYYLAIETGLQPREHLAALLWPEANPERSLASLRNTLGHLQAALRQVDGEPQSAFLTITHQSIGLNPKADVDFDLQTVERAYTLARADRSNRKLSTSSTSLPVLQCAAACQRGDFLAGFSLDDAPGFDDWASLQREIWHRRLGLILDHLSEIQFARGEFAGTTETASQWIALDTMNENAYRRKMRAHFAAGERGQALETYEACHAVLAAELGIEPEPETAALAEVIRTQSSSVSPHPAHSRPRTFRFDSPVAFLGNLFTGRVQEYQLLVESYQRAAAGQPQFVVLHGEAGIGKTRLARKFLTWAGTQGAELLQGGAYESGSHLPFQPLIEALRLRNDHKNLILDLVDDVWLTPLTRLLPDLQDNYSHLSATPKEWGNLREHLEIEIEQMQFYEPITQYTLALTKKAPLVIFLDDLQWTDSATLDLLHYAIRRWRDSASRIVLLVSLRSEALRPMTQIPFVGDSVGGLSQWLERLTRELTPIHIELKPLGELETVQMVQSILSPPASDFVQWLFNETQGQPFYLMETLKDLLERRVLLPKQRTKGQWTFALDSEHDLDKAVRVPSTVYTVIRSRLNRLSPNAFRLLVSGAVLEQQITFERMCAISNVDKDLALPALDELISGRILLEEEQPWGASTYPFINDMLRDVIYTEAGDARRRLFHQRALEVLKAEGDSEAVLAHHALAAGQAQAAFNHSVAAGREALGLSAVSEAIVHFECAYNLTREISPPEMPNITNVRDLYVQLSRVYRLCGQMEKATALDAERGRLG